MCALQLAWPRGIVINNNPCERRQYSPTCNDIRLFKMYDEYGVQRSALGKILYNTLEFFVMAMMAFGESITHYTRYRFVRQLDDRMEMPCFVSMMIRIKIQIDMTVNVL